MAHLVTNSGKASVVAALHNYANRPRHFQWGAGSGQGAADNALADTTGVNEARALGVTDIQDTDVTGDTLRTIGTLTAGGSRSITELGLFDAAGSGSPPTGGNMCVYSDFGEINLGAGDSIMFTVNVAFG
jgi:hypothetical protein